MPTNYDAAHSMAGSSWRVTIDGEDIGSDIAPLLDLEQAIRVEQRSSPTHIVMGARVARALEAHPYVTGTLELVDGSFDRAPNPTPTFAPRPPKRRDTKPAAKPRKQERRSARHTQRRR